MSAKSKVKMLNAHLPQPTSIFGVFTETMTISFMKAGVCGGVLSLLILGIVGAVEIDSGSTNDVQMPLACYHFKETNYVCAVPFSHFIKGPLWKNDAADELPLSLKDALAIAKRHAVKVVPEAVGFNAKQIVLKRIGVIWVYIIQLEPLSPKLPEFGTVMAPIQIPVLMDGTVVECAPSSIEVSCP